MLYPSNSMNNLTTVMCLLVSVFLVGILVRDKSSSFGGVGAKDASSSRNIEVIQVENNSEQVEKPCRFGLIPLMEVGPLQVVGHSYRKVHFDWHLFPGLQCERSDHSALSLPKVFYSRGCCGRLHCDAPTCDACSRSTGVYDTEADFTDSRLSEFGYVEIQRSRASHDDLRSILQNQSFGLYFPRFFHFFQLRNHQAGLIPHSFPLETHKGSLSLHFVGLTSYNTKCPPEQPHLQHADDHQKQTESPIAPVRPISLGCGYCHGRQFADSYRTLRTSSRLPISGCITVLWDWRTCLNSDPEHNQSEQFHDGKIVTADFSITGRWTSYPVLSPKSALGAAFARTRTELCPSRKELL